MVTQFLLALLVSGASATPYEVGAGDRLDVSVFGEAGLSGVHAIGGTCTIEVPLIGEVTACDRTVGSIRQEIMERLADGYVRDPRVTVDVAEYGSQRVEILGAVKEPGVVSLGRSTLLSEVIAERGGPSDPSVGEVELLSQNGTSHVYRLNELPLLSERVFVQGGDVVILRQGRQVYVHGEVRTEGPVPYREGLTAMQAMSLAGGPSEFAGLRRVYLVHQDGARVRVNIRRIANGKEADVLLKPDDKLVVQRSIF